MQSSPSRRRRLLLVSTLIVLAVAIPCGIGIWNSAQTQEKIDSALSGVTGLRVWGAGMRFAGGQFCPCAFVPKPERVFYETTDPAEIQAFIALLRPRPYLTLDPPIRTCGQVTIDFLRNEQRVLFLHLMGPDLRSSKGRLPVSSRSYDDIEEWLKQRSVRERIHSALITPAKK